ncbi:MAG: PHP-associated domain-containing protein [Candidatus Omnitrophota bacterium]
MMTVDFHVHSRYSMDCFLEPSRIVALARRHRLDGFAVTDHDTFTDIREFRELAPELFVIAGQEVSTPFGDILGLFLSKKIQETKDVEKIIAEIRGQGGLAVLAHPFKWPHLRRADDFLKLFDAIEVFNARNNIPMPFVENYLARRAVERLGLAWVCGSDTHEGFEMGCAGTCFDLDPASATQDSLKDAIVGKKTAKAPGREVNLGLEIVSHFSRLARARGK